MKFEEGDTIKAINDKSTYTHKKDGWEGIITRVYGSSKYFTGKTIKGKYSIKGDKYYDLKPKHFKLVKKGTTKEKKKIRETNIFKDKLAVYIIPTIILSIVGIIGFGSKIGYLKNVYIPSWSIITLIFGVFIFHEYNIIKHSRKLGMKYFSDFIGINMLNLVLSGMIGIGLIGLTGITNATYLLIKESYKEMLIVFGVVSGVILIIGAIIGIKYWIYKKKIEPKKEV